MSFKRFVEVGRVALINYGPDAGSLCTIVNIIDQNRVLVDGPAPITGVHRHELNIKRIMLTDLKVPAKLNASQGTLEKLWKEGDIASKWASTRLAKKRAARKARLASTDFERFEIMLAKKERAAKTK